MTYALLALPPAQEHPGDPLNIQVSIRTCWREFFAKTGLVGNRGARLLLDTQGGFDPLDL